MNEISLHMPPADVETSGCGAEGVYHSVAGSSQKRKRSPYFLPVLSVTLVILVLVWGALVFMHLEQPRERAQAAEFLALKAELENSLLNMTETEQVVAFDQVHGVENPQPLSCTQPVEFFSQV